MTTIPKVVLNHDLVQIILDGSSYRVLIAMSKGGMVEHQPFPGDQRGLVAAMSLATDVLAGKIWLSHQIKTDNLPEIPERVELKRSLNGRVGR